MILSKLKSCIVNNRIKLTMCLWALPTLLALDSSQFRQILPNKASTPHILRTVPIQ
jgi:hypothetical protein